MPAISRSVFGSYPLFFSFGVIDVAIPAVGANRSVVVTTVAKLSLVGMAVQTGIGQGSY
jgi:hypothetical protein